MEGPKWQHRHLQEVLCQPWVQCQDQNPEPWAAQEQDHVQGVPSSRQSRCELQVERQERMDLPWAWSEAEHREPWHEERSEVHREHLVGGPQALEPLQQGAVQEEPWVR